MYFAERNAMQWELRTGIVKLMDLGGTRLLHRWMKGNEAAMSQAPSCLHLPSATYSFCDVGIGGRPDMGSRTAGRALNLRISHLVRTSVGGASALGDRKAGSFIDLAGPLAGGGHARSINVWIVWWCPTGLTEAAVLARRRITGGGYEGYRYLTEVRDEICAGK